MLEQDREKRISESPQSEGEWPSERIIRILEESINRLKGFASGIKQDFSMPGPGDESSDLSDQTADKLSNGETKTDLQMLAKMASYGHDRFHTPYL